MPAQPDIEVFSQLSVEDARILRWVAMNKTQDEISRLTGFSRSMVRHRVTRLENVAGLEPMRQLGPWWIRQCDEWLEWVRRQTTLDELYG